MKRILIWISILFCLSISAQNKVIQLDGIDAYIDLNSALLSTTGGYQPYTLEAWVKTADGVDNCFISQYESLLPNGDRFQFEIRDNKLNWWKGAPNSQIRLSILSASDINDDVWHHIAGTRDAAGNVIIYIDGFFEGSGTDTYPFINTHTRIGTRNEAGGFVNAKMDEVRIWNIVRSQAEIQQTMNTSLTGNESGLIGYWNFDDGTADDLTANNHNGTIYGNLQFISDDNPPLPVTLSSFMANYSNNISTLSWTTQTETNNLGWNIYRGENEDISDGFLINNDLIPGAGTTSQSTDYTFADESDLVPGATYFYWIESVDNSGTTDLFGPARLEIQQADDDEIPPEMSEKRGLLQIYPNPFNRITNIQFNILEEDGAEISIYNIKGELIKKYSIINEQSSIQWDGTDELGKRISSGIYLCNLKVDGKVYAKKMILE